MRNVICCLRSQSSFCSVSLSVFKSHYLKNFIEIVLPFLLVESKTNILDININFTGNSFFGFDRYSGKVVPKPADSHPFGAPALAKNVLSIFFSRWHLVNDSRNKRVSAFLLCFIGFETVNFICFSKKWVVLDQTYSFKNRELLIITKNSYTLLYSSLSWNSVQNFKSNGQAVLVLPLGEHENLWFSLILHTVYH